MTLAAASAPTLSICLTCGYGSEGECHDLRGGKRLAQAIIARLATARRGFPRLEKRPEARRAPILGRLPPIETVSDLLRPLCATLASPGASA